MKRVEIRNEAEESSLFPLSVVILAKNEESNIARCVQAVSWCGEVIVVVDDQSKDRTEELAAELGARIVRNPFRSFADQRNWAMKFAALKHEWVLHLDADEVVTESLRGELTESLSNVSADLVAFKMCRKTMLGETWLKYSDGFPVWIVRLVLAGRFEFQSCGHGEVAVPPAQAGIGTIREPFLHYAFSKGWSDWIQRHNQYSDREAELEFRENLGVSLRQLLAADKSQRRAALRRLSRKLPFRGGIRFLYHYIVKLGFLDGQGGLTYCRMIATYEHWIVLKRKELEQKRVGK